MNYFPLTKSQQEWQQRIAELAEKEIGPRAAEYDAKAEYPRKSLEALRDAGLWALRVSKEYGGLGADLLTTCLVVEEISKKCPSTAMCYKMHLEASEVVNLIPTPYQLEQFVKPMAKGEVFATIAGGESSGPTGNDWRPAALEVSYVKRSNRSLVIDNIRKSYVTSAGHATHYTLFCRVEGLYTEGPPNLLMVEKDSVDWQVLGDWRGLGMRGNSSAPMLFNGSVPEGNLLGADQPTTTLWGTYLMPALVLTYGAAYLGIASGAYELACAEATKRYPSGGRRIDNPINQRRMAEMSAQIEAARALLHAAASAADQGRATSPLPYIQAKVLCSEAAVRVTQDLMTMFGGTAFAGRLPFERYFRDARAGMVMGVANDQAYQTIAGILFPEN
jgi:isovaleryl-CoA dehydrogenase